MRIRRWFVLSPLLVALAGCAATPDTVNKKVEDTYPGAQEIGRSHRDTSPFEMRALCENGRVRVVLIDRNGYPTVEQEMMLDSPTTCTCTKK
jgi:hypothetical protein